MSNISRRGFLGMLSALPIVGPLVKGWEWRDDAEEVPYEVVSKECVIENGETVDISKLPKHIETVILKKGTITW